MSYFLGKCISYFTSSRGSEKPSESMKKRFIGSRVPGELNLVDTRGYTLYWIVLTFRIHLQIESLIHWSLEGWRSSISAACETVMTQNSEFCPPPLSKNRKTGGRGPQANGPTARSCWRTGSPFASIMAGSVAKDDLEPVIVTVLPLQWKRVFLWDLSETRWR